MFLVKYLEHRPKKRRTLFHILSATIIIYYLVLFHTFSQDIHGPLEASQSAACNVLPGMEDVFVVVKTSACEARRKLPILFKSTLRCVPSYAIFSDLAETVRDQEVYDSFEGEVSDRVVNSTDEFKMYNKLKDLGSCDNLTAEDLQTADGAAENNGKFKDRGWVLDKWKFLPMIKKAQRMRPDAKWYLIVETDAYVIWPNLLQWLSQFESSEPHYLGFQTQIGSQVFAHSGAGIIMSNAAVAKVVDHFTDNRTALEAYTASEWAGDCVLGKAMQDVGIRLMWSWPHMLFHSISEVDYMMENYNKRLWCSPVLSYHHLTMGEIWALWQFQRNWFEQNPTRALLHKDVFKHFVLPWISSSRYLWDNLSGDEIGGELQPRNMKECRNACRIQHDCLQYSFSGTGCRLSRSVRLGRAVSTPENMTHSGWMMDRVEKFLEEMKGCSSEDGGWKRNYYGF